MNKTWILLNTLLLMIAGALGWQLYVSVNSYRVENDPAKLVPARDVRQTVGGEAEAVAPAAVPPAPSYNPGEFALIAEQNLFSESRTAEEPSDQPVVAEVPPLTAKPVLVGVTIVGDRRQAMIQDPANQTARRSQIKRIGDSYQGYTITDITMNHMVLENGSRREVIPLHYAKQPTAGAKTAIVPTRVVSFGQGAGAGTGAGGAAAAPNVVQTAGRAQPAPTQPTPVPTQPPQQGVPVQAQTPQGRPATPQSGRQVPGAVPQPQLGINERIDEQGRRVIRTPFGDIVRENPPQN